jgi:hypothetical protein
MIANLSIQASKRLNRQRLNYKSGLDAGAISPVTCETMAIAGENQVNQRFSSPANAYDFRLQSNHNAFPCVQVRESGGDFSKDAAEPAIARVFKGAMAALSSAIPPATVLLKH